MYGHEVLMSLQTRAKFLGTLGMIGVDEVVKNSIHGVEYELLHTF
jgi:hypothetical protein